MKFTENPYYNPDLCGLEIFDSIDTAGSYEFDMFVIWKKLDDETLWWDADSGCSCPSPFDNYDHGHDLKPVTINNFKEFDKILSEHPNISAPDYQNMRRKAKEYLKSHE